MKPDALFIFEQKEDAPTRYLLIKHIGADVPGFPAVYKRGSEKGNGYIGFRCNDTYKNKYSHIIELAGGKVFAGVNFISRNPNKVFSNDSNPNGLNRKDAVLIEFKNEGKIIEIYFFFGQAVNAETLYNLWLEGKLNMSVETIPAEKENAVSLF